MFTSRQIRKMYLDYFTTQKHLEVESSSTVPHEDDQTVLFTTAGMQQFVPNLMGLSHPKGKRLMSIQKCVRTVDIDEVGDNRHLTFFEMLGNWSLGDYFKKEALEWSFEFLTKKMNIPSEKIWVTVFGGDTDLPLDTDAEKIWLHLGIPKERMIPIGAPIGGSSKKGRGDNFWGPAGPTGPCGPCSEMHIWIGEGTPKPGQNPATDDTSFIEVWNDVFMEFYSDENGKLTKLEKQNVDTGMGLERLTMILNNKKTVFETDVYTEIFEVLEKLSGKKYPPYSGDTDEKNPITRAMRVIADHVRTASHLIADGVGASNEGRGYVLRRLIRRAVRYGKKLGFSKAFLSDISKEYIIAYSEFYPELDNRKQVIFDAFQIEEENFLKTIERGEGILESLIREKENHFIFVRHGESEDGAQGVLQHADSPLTEKGKAHAERVVQELEDKKIGKILSSPTKRALETAKTVAKNIGVSIEIFAHFAAAETGKVAGTPKEKVLPLTPLEYAETQKTGETYSSFFERVKKGISELKNFPLKKESTVIVSHRGVFSAIEAALNGGTVEDAKIARREKENAGHGIMGEWTMGNADAQISGKDAFTLFDTYGFPLDLTKEIASEHGFTVDEEGFQKEMKAQKERSRASSNFDRKGQGNETFQNLPATAFVGYTETQCETKILALVESVETHRNASLPTSQQYKIVFEKTPFYAESGGQVGDMGTIQIGNTMLLVMDTKKLDNGVFVHTVETHCNESLQIGDTVTLRIDIPRRERIKRHHSGAHLLHSALKKVLGNHVEQAGSLVDEHRTRFDFSHPKALSETEIRAVELQISEWVTNALPVFTKEMPLKEAKKAGAQALFSEKYGDIVRTIKMGDESFELCGGTHISNTAEIGSVKILSESSVASGIRRIEMVVGQTAQELFWEKYEAIELLSKKMKTSPDKLFERVDSLFLEKKTLEETLKKAEKELLSFEADEILQRIGEKTQNICEPLPTADLQKISALVKILQEKGIPTVALFTEDGGVSIATNGEKSAKDLLLSVLQLFGGKGGGSQKFAQGSGVNIEKFSKIREIFMV